MANSYPKLNPVNAFIWRIVHRDNLPWLLANGIHARSSLAHDPNYVNIGNRELILRRTTRVIPIPPSGTLNDYVPFYFTPFSPMMYNIHTGRGEVTRRSNDEICILVSSLHRVARIEIPFVFSDRHAYTAMAKFSSSIGDLGVIDWPLLQARNFARSSDDPEQIERYQAEALVYKHLPIEGLIGVVCYTEQVKLSIESQCVSLGLSLDVHVLPRWYF